MKEIEVTNIRAVLECKVCHRKSVTTRDANRNIGDSVFTWCDGECQTYTHHGIIAKRMNIQELDLPEPPREPVPPMIADPDIGKAEMADEHLERPKDGLDEDE